MIEIIEALTAKVAADASLKAGLTGIYGVRPDPTTALPWGLIEPVSGDYDYNTGKNYLEDVTIQVSFFAKKLADVRTAVRNWKRLVPRHPLTLSEGRTLAIDLTGETHFYEPDAGGVFSIIHCVLEFTVMQQQAIA